MGEGRRCHLLILRYFLTAAHIFYFSSSPFSGHLLSLMAIPLPHIAIERQSCRRCPASTKIARHIPHTCFLRFRFIFRLFRRLFIGRLIFSGILAFLLLSLYIRYGLFQLLYNITPRKYAIQPFLYLASLCFSSFHIWSYYYAYFGMIVISLLFDWDYRARVSSIYHAPH